MPYNSPSEVPDNVPVKYKAQFAEVWNSVYASSIADKKSPAQAEEDAFKQAHGVVLKAKQKDARDVSSDGPGFGPVETKNEDGGQVSDPQQTLRYSEDQPRQADGKFGIGTGEGKNEVHEHMKSAGYSIAGFKAGASGIHSGWTKEGEAGRVLLHEGNDGKTSWEKKDESGNTVAKGEGKPDVKSSDVHVQK